MIRMEVALEYDGAEPTEWHTASAMDPARTGRITVGVPARFDGLVRLVARPVGDEAILWRGQPLSVRAGDSVCQEFGLSSDFDPGLLCFAEVDGKWQPE